MTNAVIGFTGDTAYHPPLAEHVRGAGLLIHEASHGDREPARENASGHSGAAQATEIAKAAGVSQLVLLHCGSEAADKAVAAARRIFPETIYPRDGEVIHVQ